MKKWMIVLAMLVCLVGVTACQSRTEEETANSQEMGTEIVSGQTQEDSFGSVMMRAGLNTVMGMVTVFFVLILIILVISSFSLLSQGQKKEDVQQKVIEEPVLPEEEPMDDLELIAVIAAAIAASEGADSVDDYVVRSIRRRR